MSEIPYQYVVDIMVDDMPQATERENGKICDDSGSSYGGVHEMDYGTYSITDTRKQNSIDKIYILLSEPTNGSKYLIKGDLILFLI